MNTVLLLIVAAFATECRELMLHPSTGQLDHLRQLVQCPLISHLVTCELTTPVPAPTTIGMLEQRVINEKCQLPPPPPALLCRPMLMLSEEAVLSDQCQTLHDAGIILS